METNIYTEKDAFRELVEWSQDRPKWQQEALKRIILKDCHLSSIDIEEIIEICINPSLPFNPITIDDINSSTTPGDSVSMASISNPVGINALSDKGKLEFSKTGLSIIYGDNGSGKSGYVRILKKACNTRDGKFDIKGDIEDVEQKIQSANIEFFVGDKINTMNWTPEQKAEPSLSNISVFDSKSAHIHVEKTNPISYIPEPMKILGKLSDTCDLVKQNIDSRILSLKEQTPESIKNSTLNNQTQAGIFLNNLSNLSSESDLQRLSSLNADEQKALSKLKTDFATDPGIVAKKIESQINKVLEYKQKLQKLHASVTEKAFNNRDNLKKEQSNKQAAAALASEKLFKSSPLPGIGEEIWHNLWEAARKYSDQVAYPNNKFPKVTIGKDHCVLCLQKIDKDSSLRYLNFEEFIQGSTKDEERTATIKYKNNILNSKEFDMPIRDIKEVVRFFEEDLGCDELSQNIRASFLTAKWKLRYYVRGLTPQVKIREIPENNLNKIINYLENRASQFLADKKSSEYKALFMELMELKDREYLGSIIEDIKKEISRQKKIIELNTKSRTAAKRPITNKNKELSDKLVTDALRGRFAREISKFKLFRMPVELRKVKDQNAVSFFQVCFVGNPKEPVGEIFSEGEYRCIALAAFLAELVTSRSYSGIIFDDPMSSLDHIHRKEVAARLVDESQYRQVIVFTHDLTFLYELKKASDEKDISSIHYQTIKRKQERPGHIENDLPVKAKSALGVANNIRSEIKNARSNFDQLNDMQRTIFLKGIIEQIREAWDQGIADFILPVLGRFDSRIKGSSLYKLEVLDKEDLKIINQARSRLSEFLHLSSESINPPDKNCDDLKEEVSILEKWLENIGNKQKGATPLK